MQGKRIVIEGPTCVGKSTQVKNLGKKLAEAGMDVVTTREPGGTPEAEAIRSEIFRLKALNELSSYDEVWMFYAARASLMEWSMKQIEQGKVVISDRDYLSTRIVQSVFGSPMALIDEMHRDLYVGQGYPEPDLRILLTISQEELRKRLLIRGAEEDAFDREHKKVFEVACAYGALAYDILTRRSQFRENTVVVNANGPEDVVSRQILREVDRRFDLGLEGKEGFIYRGYGSEEGTRRHKKEF